MIKLKKGEELNQNIALSQYDTDFANRKSCIKTNKIIGDKSSEILDEEIVNEKLKKAQEYESPKKRKKNAILSVIFLLINITVVAIIANSMIKSTQQDGVSLISLLESQGSKLWWIVGGVLLVAFSLLLDASVFAILIKKTTGKFRPMLSFKATAIGKYYECITPFSAGTQPAQIYHLSKGGVSAGVATSIPLMKLIVYNIINVLLAACMLIFVLPQIESVSYLNDIIMTVFKVFAWIGVIFSGLISLFTLLIARSKIVGKILAKWVVKIGYKLHIIKNYRTAYDKLMRHVWEFQGSINYLRKNVWTLVCMIAIGVFQYIVFASLPFVVCMAFSPTEIVGFGALAEYWIESIARYYVCLMAAMWIPLPGGTGMMEVSFIAMFGGSRFLGNNNIIWGFLVWRILTYYLVILQGIVMIIANTIVGIRKNKKGKIETMVTMPPALK